MIYILFLAEAVRFELTNGFPRRQFSRLLPSTTRPRFLRNRHYTQIIACRAVKRTSQTDAPQRRIGRDGGRSLRIVNMKYLRYAA